MGFFRKQSGDPTHASPLTRLFKGSSQTKLVEEATPQATASPACNGGPGVLWGDTYPPEYEAYERNFPFAFPWSRPSHKTAPRYVQDTTGWWYNPQAVENGKAVLACTGDLMGEPRYQRAYRYGDRFCFEPSFKYVRALLTSADFAVGNLETTITDVTPYACEWHNIEGKYHCNAPKDFLQGIRYAGFDALVTANNHNCDSAVMGLVDTLDALDEYTFMHTGTFRPNDQSGRALLVCVNGLRLALLSYATYFNKLETNFTQRGRDELLNAYSAAKAQADVAWARNKGAEYVISYVHWGREYTHEVSDRQRSIAQELADAGVDYIVGSHSHSLQPHDALTAQDGRTVPVIYSLGNFVTNESRKICKHTGVMQLVLERTPQGISLKNEFLVPCYVFDAIETSSFPVVPTDVSLNGGVDRQTLVHAQKEIRDVMGPIAECTSTALSVSELCTILGAEQPDGIQRQFFSRLSSSPDTVQKGCAFFGLIWNGTEELHSMYKKGAAALVTNRPIDGLPCIVVDDIHEAYIRAGAAIRERYTQTTSIVISGSVGKTTTKEILECVCRDNFITLASHGNMNTRHTAMSVMKTLRDYHEIYIQEAHEGDPRSLETIARIVQPRYAIITNIDIAHRENFATDEEFVACFTEVTAGLQEGGTLFINGDDARLMAAMDAYKDASFTIKTFGMVGENLDYRACLVASDGASITIDITHGSDTVRITLPSPIETNAYNVAAAFAVAHALGIPASKIASGVAHYTSSGMRQNVVEVNGLTAMFDCRSASPISMRSSLTSFVRMQPAPGCKRIAVLGEMHLGEDLIEEAHRDIGRLVTELGIDYLFCYGDAARFIYEEALSHGFDSSKARMCPTKRELELNLCEIMQPGDTLLIKGGRRMYLNSTIRKLFNITVSVD